MFNAREPGANAAVGQGIFNRSHCALAPSPAKQGGESEWERGKREGRDWKQGDLARFLSYSTSEDIDWSAKSLFLLSLQNLIWMPYSKRPVLLLSALNKEVNLFNNTWAFKLTQHFLPFFSCTSFSMLARGFLMTLHEDFQCTLWTSLTVRWPMFMKALAWLLNFCDAMSCLQCALNVLCDTCNSSPTSFFCFDKSRWVSSVANCRWDPCTGPLMKMRTGCRWGF